eukprot:2435927-Prymnesium_polylepis.2
MLKRGRCDHRAVDVRRWLSGGTVISLIVNQRQRAAALGSFACLGRALGLAAARPTGLRSGRVAPRGAGRHGGGTPPAGHAHGTQLAGSLAVLCALTLCSRSEITSHFDRETGEVSGTHGSPQYTTATTPDTPSDRTSRLLASRQPPVHPQRARVGCVYRDHTGQDTNRGHPPPVWAARRVALVPSASRTLQLR